MDQILGPPKTPATTLYLTVDPFGLSRKVTTTILTDAPDRQLGRSFISTTDMARGTHIVRFGFGNDDVSLLTAYVTARLTAWAADLAWN